MTGSDSESDSEIERILYEKACGPGFKDMERRCPKIKKIKGLIVFEPSYDIDAIVQSVIDYFNE